MMYHEEDNIPEEQQQAIFNSNRYMLFAIDCCDRMFKDQFEGTSQFKNVLSTIRVFLDGQLMQKSGKAGNRFAIVVITDNKDTMTISNFNDNLPDVLEKLKDLCKKSDDELKEIYNRADSFRFGEFLFNVRSKFKDHFASEYLKYVVYISNDDNPIDGDEDEMFRAVNQAKAFEDTKIKFQLITFNPTFDYGLFFKEILQSWGYSYDYEYLTDSISLQDKLLSLLPLRGVKTKFYILPSRKNVFMDVIEKSFIKVFKLDNNVLVNRQDLKEVKKITQKESSGKYKVKYSKKDDSSVLLSEEDNKIFVDDNVSVGINLIGTSLKLNEPGMHSTNPKFIQLNQYYKNELFDLIWSYCTEKNRTIICSRKYRVDSVPKLVELSPCIINNVKSFLMLGVPSSCDVRNRQIFSAFYEQRPLDDTELMEMVDNFVIKGQFEYDSSDIRNTVAGRKLSYIRSQLLQEESEEVPSIKDVDFVERLVVEKAMRDLMVYNPQMKKRKAPATKGSTKKTKTE